jgi:LPXTG-site transpeptidase (sortase) family protein
VSGKRRLRCEYTYQGAHVRMSTKSVWMGLPVAVAALLMMALSVACGGDKPAVATTEPTVAATATTPPPPPTATPTPFAGPIGRLQMPSLKIDYPIEEIAVNAANEMETPKGENTHVGWYHIWDRPGWGGNSVFSAHVYYRNQGAPFKDLAKSKDGDEVVVVMENGDTYTYRVFSNKRYHRDTIPMGEIIWPQNRNGKEWITLITCGGELDSSGQEYVSRDVIIAERVK